MFHRDVNTTETRLKSKVISLGFSLLNIFFGS